MAGEEFTDDAALWALVAGIASMIFVMFGPGTVLEHLGLVGGLIAVVKGLRVLRTGTEHKKLAATGVITGTIAVSIWLVIRVYSGMIFLWNAIT